MLAGIGSDLGTLDDTLEAALCVEPPGTLDLVIRLAVNTTANCANAQIVLGGTVEGDSAVALALVLNPDAGPIVALTFDILQSLADEPSTDYDSLSLVIDSGGVVVTGAGGDVVTCPDNGIECVTDVCNPANGLCAGVNDPADTPCDSGGGPDSGTCDGAGLCEAAAAALTCDPTGGGAVTPCLSAAVLADDCFIVTGSVPVPTAPIIVPTEPLFDGVQTAVFPQAQASLPWPLLCTLAGPAGRGADLRDSALEMVQAGSSAPDEERLASR